jgi:hypothetical protein
MIFDEDKYQKGYIDLVALLFPWVRRFVFMGDRYQGGHHEPNTDCKLNDPEKLGNMAMLAPLSARYITGTWRCSAPIANLTRTPSFSRGHGLLAFAHVTPNNGRDLEPFFPNKSPEELERLSKQAGRYLCSEARVAWSSALSGNPGTTFAGSQGLTSPLSIVEVDDTVLRYVSPEITHAVLTRSNNLIVVVKLVSGGHHDQLILMNEIWSKVLSYRHEYFANGRVARIRPEDSYDIKKVIGRPLPADVTITMAGPPDKLTNADFLRECGMEYDFADFIDPDSAVPVKVGKRLNPDDEIYKANPTFKVHMLHTKEVELTKEPVLVEPEAALAPKLPTKLPFASLDALDEQHHSTVLQRFDAELSHKNLYSEQYRDDLLHRKDATELLRAAAKKSRKPRGKVLQDMLSKGRDNPLMYKPAAWYWGADQRNVDAASFSAGMSQRIRRADYRSNLAEIKDEAGYGSALWLALCKTSGWNPGEVVPLTNDDVYSAMEVFEGRRADRSKSLQKSSLNRAEPDYIGLLTAKNQWKLKDEDFKKAKGLQPIFIRADKYLFQFGWVGVLLLDRIIRDMPPTIYLHAKKTLEQLETWCGTYANYSHHEMLDMSGFDGSVRGGAVNLMCHLMKRYNIPQHLIDVYADDKADFKTRTIHFGLMTLSGEIFTWLTNTMFSLAREALKFDLPYHTPIAVSGEDMCRETGRPVSDDWHLYEPYDHCVEKRQVSEYGSFCSFTIKGGLMYKNPIILYKRLRGLIEAGKTNDIALGYFAMMAHNYSFGDLLLDVMTPRELEHQAGVNTIMFNLRDVPGVPKMDYSLLRKVHLDVLDRGRDLDFLQKLLNFLPDLVVSEGPPITDRQVLYDEA